jgi:hypothetical protein
MLGFQATEETSSAPKRRSITSKQCFRSGSGLDPNAIRSVYLDPDSGSGNRIRIQEDKNCPQKYKKVVLSNGCSLLRADGFSCSLEVIYGGLGISKFQFFIKKISIFFQL